MSSALLWLAYVHILYSGILYAQTFSPASPGWTQRKLLGGVCRIQTGARAEDVINLEPLVRTDGIPRYEFAKFHTVISLVKYLCRDLWPIRSTSRVLLKTSSGCLELEYTCTVAGRREDVVQVQQV